MTAKNAINQNTGIIFVTTYFILLAVSSLVVLLASALFPRTVVLGTADISKTWAIIHSMGTLALVNTFAIPFVGELENKRGKIFSPREEMVCYLATNFVGIWIIARFADQLGFGIKSWLAALALAATLDLVQGMVMMQVKKLRKKDSP